MDSGIIETEFQHSVASGIWRVWQKRNLSPVWRFLQRSSQPFLASLRLGGYRQIYAGKVKAITDHGRILVPAAEADAILKTAGIYDGVKPKSVRTKSEIQSLTPALTNVWQSFLNARRQSQPSKISQHAVAGTKKWPSSPVARQAAMTRLARQGKAKGH